MTDDPEKHKFIKMDKKGSFPSTFAANANKPITLDSSIKAVAFNRQDGAAGSQMSKVQQRFPSRNRGHPSGNTNFRNDSYRNKPFPRGRGNFDKRGKPRGGSTTSEPVANEKEEAEAGSLHFPGGKKRNFDDLWGFHFAPRESRHLGYSQFFGHGQSHPPGRGHLRYQQFGSHNRAKYAKDYLLANCQFLVRMGEDYTVYLADPNLLVNWDLIEHVRIRIDGETPKCPICLDFPIAAKITKCGHIYCWPCFLHYLALSDNKVRTCPICYEPVSRKDLKSVSLLSQEGVQIGSKIDMQLMVRMKDSLLAYPVEKKGGWESRFCKILQVIPETVIQTVIFNERVELDSVCAAEPDAPEVCFIQEALEALNSREISLTELQLQLSKDVEIPPNGLLPPDVVVPSTMNVDVLPVEEVADVNAMKKPKTRNDSVSSNSSCGHGDIAQRQVDAQGDCYFYQINDGRNVFLHPLNMAMLWRELGSDPEKWPQVLTFDVIDVESKSATDEVRKKMKFLRHLPKNAPFDLVEVSMNEWGISPEIYADFASQISHREQRRKKRAKEEKNLERKLREREASEFNKFRHLPQITSPKEFPAFGSNVFQPEMEISEFPEHVLKDTAVVNSNVELPSDESLTCDGPVSSIASSFAQIAGKAPLKKSPTFPLPGQGAWGTAIATAKPPVTTHHRHSDSENDGEDYVPVPNYRASMSDAIERAMAGLDLHRSGESSSSTQSPTSSGNKKKKSKKGKVLFATGMGGFQ